MNMILKKMMIEICLVVFKILRIPRNVVILESVPDFEGSPKCIAAEIERRYNGKYLFFWAVEKETCYSNNEHVLYFWGKVSLADKIRKYYYLLRTKLIIDSNRPVKKEYGKCFRVFTRHGGTLKKNDKYMKSLGKMDYVLSLSPFLADVDFKILQGTSVTKKSQVLCLGYPANDMLFADFDLYNCDLLKGKRYRKIVAWLPTFRNHKNGDESISLEKTNLYSMPIVHNMDDLKTLNQALQKINVLLILQLHPAQIAVMPKEEFSHICYLTPEKKKANGIETPNLLHCADALITDYSAAYYEYILLNKPIGLSIDDVKEYTEKIGFYINYDEVICGARLSNLEDMISFLTDVAHDCDSYYNERNRSLKKIHQYVDGRSTERVVDFMAKEMDL